MRREPSGSSVSSSPNLLTQEDHRRSAQVRSKMRLPAVQHERRGLKAFALQVPRKPFTLRDPYHRHPQDAAHGGADGFRVAGIDRVRRDRDARQRCASTVLMIVPRFRGLAVDAASTMSWQLCAMSWSSSAPASP